MLLKILLHYQHSKNLIGAFQFEEKNSFSTKLHGICWIRSAQLPTTMSLFYKQQISGIVYYCGFPMHPFDRHKIVFRNGKTNLFLEITPRPRLRFRWSNWTCLYFHFWKFRQLHNSPYLPPCTRSCVWLRITIYDSFILHGIRLLVFRFFAFICYNQTPQALSICYESAFTLTSG